VPSAPDTTSATSFLLDSGNRLGHATSSAAALSNVRPAGGTGSTADGSEVKIVAAGSFPGSILGDVLVIPTLTNNVASVHQLAIQGFTSIFLSERRGGQVYIVDDNNQVVAQGDSDYVINFAPPAGRILALHNRRSPPGDTTIAQAVRRMQARLRGLGKAQVIAMARDDYIDNFPLKPSDIERYWQEHPDALASTFRANSSRHRPDDTWRGNPGDRVHQDQFTVSVKAVVHQFTGVGVYVDRSTDFTMVFFGYKSDTAIAKAKALWRVRQRYKLFGHRIRVFQQDSLPAQMAEAPEDAALAMGIQQVFKAPHEKASLEESMVHTIKHMMIICMALAPWVPHTCWIFCVIRTVCLMNLRTAPDTHVSRVEAFTGVRPDWDRLPIDDFGAPYAVWLSPEERDNALSPHGALAAYLCPCTRSVYDTHYFLLMDRTGHRVVRRGTYKRLAEVPAEWRSIRQDTAIEVTIEDAPLPGEFDYPMDGLPPHFPMQGLTTSATQTDPPVGPPPPPRRSARLAQQGPPSIASLASDVDTPGFLESSSSQTDDQDNDGSIMHGIPDAVLSPSVSSDTAHPGKCRGTPPAIPAQNGLVLEGRLESAGSVRRPYMPEEVHRSVMGLTGSSSEHAGSSPCAGSSSSCAPASRLPREAGQVTSPTPPALERLLNLVPNSRLPSPIF